MKHIDKFFSAIAEFLLKYPLGLIAIGLFFAVMGWAHAYFGDMVSACADFFLVAVYVYLYCLTKSPK